MSTTPTLTRSVTPSIVTQSPSRLRNIPLPNRLVKSSSSSQIKEKAQAQGGVVGQPFQRLREDHVMDTRTPSPSNSSNGDGAGAYQPDLSKEVAMLSTKLVNAINYQTNLDDSLQATRHQLDRAQSQLEQVQAEKQTLDDGIAQGVWVKKSEMDATIAQVRAELAREREQREAAERVKRQTDGEVESLTSSLFEQANKMVAEARRDTEAVERRNSQLRGRLADTETLLASQQEQLQDLKLTMEALERTATSATQDASLPSTPVNMDSGACEAIQQQSPRMPEPADVTPNHPLHFSQLLHPVLRTDVAAYNDFAELLASARKAAPHSRNASGNVNPATSTTQQPPNSNTSTTTAFTTMTVAPTTTTQPPASTSSPSLPGAFSFASSHSPSSSQSNSTYAPALKDSKFYKRILTEDLDPTLRLDLAPGLSFLSRRSVQSSLLNGTLIVEPFAPTSAWKLYAPVFPCALCGEARKDEKYTRKHRFRTSESEEAQRYPMCDFCVGRVRACGDFLGFLRLVREGFWRVGEEGDGGFEERAAWEEAVRLRERMFWARVGGGVVPAAASAVAGQKRPGTPSKVPAAVSGGETDGLDRRSSDSLTAEESRALEGFVGGEDVFQDSRRSQQTRGNEAMVDEPSSSIGAPKADEKEALEAQAKELKRRTMLHLSEGIPPVLNSTPTSTSDSIASNDNDNDASSASQDEQIQASEQIQREEAGQVTPSRSRRSSTASDDESDLEPMVSAEETPDSPSSPPPPVPPHRQGVSTPPSVNPSGSVGVLEAPARPSLEGRTSSSASSVLARVRAMEAKNAEGK